MSDITISERVAAFREWEVHHARWDMHSMESALSPSVLLNWLPDEILDHVLPTGRTLRAHIELQLSEAKRILAEREERMLAARNLSVQELWDKVDPLKKRDPEPA